jgi:hypothetical protein
VYVPLPDFDASDTFSFTARDVHGTAASVPGTITIHLLPVNDPPKATLSALQVDEDSPLTFQLSGEDVDDVSLRYILHGVPPIGSLRVRATEGAVWQAVSVTPNGTIGATWGDHVVLAASHALAWTPPAHYNQLADPRLFVPLVPASDGGLVEAQVGPPSLRYSVCDAVVCSEVTEVLITVIPVYDPPEARDGNVTT